MPLFEIVVLEVPTEKEAKDGAKEKILVDTKVIAKDEQSAVLKCIMDHKDDVKDMEKISVLIRPFVS